MRLHLATVLAALLAMEGAGALEVAIGRAIPVSTRAVNQLSQSFTVPRESNSNFEFWTPTQRS